MARLSEHGMRFAKRPNEAERYAWRSVATVMCLALAMTLGLWTSAPERASAEDRHIFLYVTTLGGWSRTPGGGDGGPGPALAVIQGDNVTITLTSEDDPPVEHGLFIDYNDNGLPDGEDFISGMTSDTITFSFTPQTPGLFDYCDRFVLTNCGTWTTEPNQAPAAEILAPEAGASWTEGSPHEIVFNVSDPDGDALTVVLSYSYNNNGGTTQDSIPGPVPVGTNPNRYVWTPTGFHGADTRIHLVVQDPHGHSTAVASPVFEVDDTAPTIVSRKPVQGATSVDRGTGIVVNWSEQMDPATGAPESFGVQVQGGPWLEGTRTWPDGRDMVFQPASPLSEATTYVVLVNGTARDSSDPGNRFTGESWFFSTSPAVIDPNRPTILRVGVDPPQQFPDAPVNLTADVQDDMGISRVDAAITGPSFDENVTMAHLSGTTWYVNRTFSAVGAYSVTIWAMDMAGNVASQGIGFDISPSGNTGVLAPASVTATTSDGLVEVRWTPVSFPGLEGYHVYRGESDTGSFQRLTTAPVPSTAPAVYHDEPPTGRTYFYTVTAVTQTGAESPYAPRYAVTIPPYQPSPLGDPVPWAIAGLTLALIMGVLYATSLWRRRST